MKKSVSDIIHEHNNTLSRVNNLEDRMKRNSKALASSFKAMVEVLAFYHAHKADLERVLSDHAQTDLEQAITTIKRAISEGVLDASD
jgi:hypothetical protein